MNSSRVIVLLASFSERPVYANMKTFEVDPPERRAILWRINERTATWERLSQLRRLVPYVPKLLKSE
jgi:hypothetical protein